VPNIKRHKLISRGVIGAGAVLAGIGLWASIANPGPIASDSTSTAALSIPYVAPSSGFGLSDGFLTPLVTPNFTATSQSVPAALPPGTTNSASTPAPATNLPLTTTPSPAATPTPVPAPKIVTAPAPAPAPQPRLRTRAS
jgi:hypothetical protein